MEAPAFMRNHIVSILTRTTAEISIEYVDYVIARSYVEALDEWIQGCDCTPKHKLLIFSRRWSHFFPSVIQLILVLSISWHALQLIPEYFSAKNEPETWARFLILYFTIFYVFVSFGRFSGEMLEEAVDSYPTLSYLKLNKGDENLIKKFKDRRNRAITKFIFGAVYFVILGIVATKLEKILPFF